MKKLKWGVIGCGGIADRQTIPGLMFAENAVLNAVMDLNYELAKDVSSKYGNPAVCRTVEELLSSDVDAVYIATPVFCHKEQAIAAIAAGKHVLIEKPVALNTDDVREISGFAKEKNVKISVGMMMRFHTYHQHVKAIIDEGKLGQIILARAKFSCWYPKIENCWRQQKELGGGGALMDLGVHCIDLLQYIIGKKTLSVAANCRNMTFGYEVDDTAAVFLNMESGISGYVDVNFNIPDAASQSRVEIYGTKGSIIADGTLSQLEEGNLKVSLSEDGDGVTKQGKIMSYSPDKPNGNMYTKEIESFSNAILNDTEPEVSIDDAIHVQEIVDAAYESAEKLTFVSI